MTDRIIFRAKDWQLFLGFVAVWILETVLHVHFFVAVVFMYLMIIGMSLKPFLPRRFQTSYSVFLVANSLLVISILYIMNFASLETNSITALMLVVILVSYYVTATFLARALRSIETRDTATFRHYFIDILWFGAFCPLGVWVIQPRLNVLVNKFNQ